MAGRPGHHGGVRNLESTIDRLFGERIRIDDRYARDTWSAVTNVEWRAPDSDVVVVLSFREAGALIAAIRGAGSYLDWYCCGRPGFVAPEIAAALAAEGWTYRALV